MKNVLIIGNGFDLDLGLPTRYSDFANSDYWPHDDRVPDGRSVFSIAKGEEYHALSFSLEKRLKTENWFDLEESLLDYATKEVSGLANDLYSAKNDIDYYHELQSKLCDYLIDVQSNTPINTKALAGDILRAILDNGYFDNIFSFNYTDLNYLANQLGISKTIKYTHVHGKLSDRSIILGVNESNLKDEYDEFHKSTSEFYQSNNLPQALDEANEVIFYGLSFGFIDFDYFANFFISLNENLIPEKEKKHISIFTKDNVSEKDIKKRLRKAGINHIQLRSNCYLDFVYSGTSTNALHEFFKRLKNNSKNAHNRALRSLGSKV